jgi:predicted AlkP superfamily pyrophosphatase or phosphodiesterase
MNRVFVLDVVGLSESLLGEHMPCLSALVKRGGARPIRTIAPAVTCPVQATFLTGALPKDHGIVGNGWYFRDLCEVMFWKQSDRLIAGEKLWDEARRRDPSFRCAKLFWWYNMYTSADVTVTPRPMYPADGRKIPDIHTYPADLRDDLNEHLGAFPLFSFWGPTADIESSKWIASSAIHVDRAYSPTLSLVYLPHLDYNLQRLGPNDPALASDLAQIDAVCGELIEHADETDAAVIVLSEYAITEVRGPVHVNRVLRRNGLLEVREELGRELLDPGASDAFAVADHQVAHIYVKKRELVDEVRRMIAQEPGVDAVLDGDGKTSIGLDHERSGELVAIAKPDCWFTYYHWLDDDRAPDFARTVDIHRKPGYDPAELFLDPNLALPKVSIGWRLLKKTLGFRTLMDVIPLDANLVRGSHGRPNQNGEEGPILISSRPELLPDGPLEATSVKRVILDHVFGGDR